MNRTLYLYGERRTVKARNLAADPAKYTSQEDRQYLPAADPDFDVIYAIRPQSAMIWRLPDYEDSQRRWRS
jgi:hypothetical protein